MSTLLRLEYLILAGAFILSGLIIWDRISNYTLKIKEKNLEKKIAKLEKALKELSNKNPETREILKNHGLL